MTSKAIFVITKQITKMFEYHAIFQRNWVYASYNDFVLKFL